MKNKRYNIAVLYSHYPHYRSGIFQRLSKSDNYNYMFYFSKMNFEVRSANSLINTHYLPHMKYGNVHIQLGFIKEILKYRFDAIIVLSNPYIFSNWIYSIIARLMGIKVLFWTHGWLRKDPWWKGLIRSFFYKIPNVLLLYGERARSIGGKNGFPEKKMHVIYNSLEYEIQKTTFKMIDTNCLVQDTENVYFIYIGRLLDAVKLDLAIGALALIRSKTGISYPLIIIGDGPCKNRLVAQSNNLSVNTIFKGEIYDEKEIAPLIYGARALVAPGKVGLSAIHSLAYGTPVITHNNMDFQMPEVEAIIPNISGDLFEMDSVEDLSKILLKWAQKKRIQSERIAAIEVIENKYSPDKQKTEIELVLDRLLNA